MWRGTGRDTRRPANHPDRPAAAHPVRADAGTDEEEPAACQPRARPREAGMIQQAVTALVPEHPEAGEKPAEPGVGGDEALVTRELLVEEISIDGMCGVY